MGSPSSVRRHLICLLDYNTAQNTYKVLVYSGENEAFSGTSGEILSIPLKVAESTSNSTGNKDVSINNIVIVNTSSDGSLERLTPNTITSTINIRIPAESINIPDELTLNVDDTSTLTATITPEGTSDDTEWTSDNKDVATVDNKGNVTAVSEGKAIITAQCGDFSASCGVTVVIPAKSVELDPTTLRLEVGQSVELEATITPAETTDQTVTWSSNHEEIATVVNGIITALSDGSATITATCGTKSATCDVEVFSTTKYTLIDSQKYNRDVDAKNVEVKYERNFEYDIWQCLFIPFDLSYEEWSPYAKVAEYSGIHEYDNNEDGIIECITVEYRTVKEGKIVPNVPYVIKPLQLGEMKLTCEDKFLAAAKAGSIDCSSTRNTYTLQGTYTTINGEDLSEAYVIGAEGL